MEDALNMKVFGIAQSLESDQLPLYHGTKSSIIASLIQTTDTRKIQPDTSGCMIELSILFQKTQPSRMQTYADSLKFFYRDIMEISSWFIRCDVITDRNFEGSLKEGTRENRRSKTGLIFTFDNCSEVLPNFIRKFLSNFINKTNLNK